MAKIRLHNVYARTEDGKGYKTYPTMDIEYQQGDNDEKFADIIMRRTEGVISTIEAYDELAEDMIISPEQARNHKFFGKNATAVVTTIVPFLLKHGNEEMFSANKKLKVEEIVGE